MSATTSNGTGSHGDVLRILDRFGLAASSVESVTELLVGTGSQNLRVRATDGDWVLKRYGAGVDLGRLRRAHRWEHRLEEAGFPVAPLRRTASGSTVVAHGDEHYVMHAWVDGQHLTIADRDDLLERQPELATDLGSMLGTLHRISREGEPDVLEEPAGDPDHLLQAPRHTLRSLRRPRLRPPFVSRWQALRLRRRKSAFDRWILQVVPDVAAHARGLARRSIATAVGPTDIGLVHHDLNWENLVLDESLRPRALLDFDNSTLAPWVLEVGAAAVVLAGTRPEDLDRFLAGYRQASPVPVDLGLVRVAMELKCVQSILNSVVIYLDGDTDLTLRGPWCRHLYASLTALVESDTAGRSAARLRRSVHGPRVGWAQQEDDHGQRAT